MKCRFCKTELHHIFIDLINSPPSNSFLTKEQLNEPEVYFPLKVYTCDSCFLVQIDEYKKSDAIFDQDYVYFSSYSTSWLEHASRYVNMMMERFGYSNSSLVVELASNDGYLLQYFQQKKIPVLGIEPTSNTANVAISKGIDTVVDFFGVRLAEKLAKKDKKADLIIGNNVLAHVPDIVDFVDGIKLLLKPNGVVTMEFPHLLRMIQGNQFDTIYHEHFSYLSCFTVSKIFESAGLELFDVDEIPTHGGSLRVYAKHKKNLSIEVSSSVAKLINKEKEAGIASLKYYKGFEDTAFQVKTQLLKFLLEAASNGKSVAAYGAAAKGNTLLNYCGVKNDLIEFVTDANPHKQNKWLPASHIPVVNEEYLKQRKPDYVIIMPWNLKDEITTQLLYIREWDGKFVVCIPELQVF